MKLLFGLLVVVSSFSFSQQMGCEHCYSLEQALIQPSKVKSLLLSNQAIAEFPLELARFKNLTYLDVSFNNIHDFPDTTFLHEQLVKINFNNNPGIPESKLFAYLEHFPNLEEISLNNCGVFDLPPSLGELKSLKKLSVKNNSINALPVELNDLVELKEIDISNNMFRALPYVIGGQWSLEKLAIQGNPLEGLEEVIKHLNNLPNFKSLSISMDGELIKKLGVFRDLTLQELTINQSIITPKFERLLNNTSIQDLVFVECTFDPEDGPMRYGSIRSIDFIRCTHIPDLRKAENLRSVAVVSSRGEGMEGLSALTQLEKLDVRTQNLSEDLKLKLIKELPTTQIQMDNYPFSEKFAQNKLDAIAPQQAKEFNISADQADIIVLENMQLDIPANAFTLADGSKYEGKVTISMKEYFDPVSMLLDGIPMTFNNNGQRELFGSNGMFDIRVTAENGEPLFPDPDNLIQVSINDMQPENTGDLFVFNDATNEWENASPAAANTMQRSNNVDWRQRIADSINALNLDNRITMQEIPIFLSLRHKRKNHDPSLLTFNAYTRPGFKTFQRLNSTGYNIYPKNLSQREIAQQTWRIDTVLTPALDTMLREIRQRSKFKNKKGEYISEYSYRGREIKNIQIVPDIANDNFRMVFYHRNKKVSLPVYVDNRTNNTGSVMREQLRFYKKYEAQKKKDERTARKDERKKQKLLKKSVDNLREQLIQQTIWMRQNQLNPSPWTNARTEQISFGLTSFGIINVDYFMKRRPIRYIAMEDAIANQSGELIAIPEYVSVLVFEANSLLGASRGNVPDLNGDRSLIVMTLENNQIGVAKSNGKKSSQKFDLNTFSIEGLTPDEVHNKIMALR